MTKYEIILYWSQEDQAFIAEVPSWPAVRLTALPGKRPLPTPKWSLPSGWRLLGNSDALSRNPRVGSRSPEPSGWSKRLYCDFHVIDGGMRSWDWLAELTHDLKMSG